MGANTKIEWCDHSLNWWWGCTKVDTGCRNCYADFFSRRTGDDIWGANKPRRLIKKAPKMLQAMERKAERLRQIDSVFVNDMSDFFEEHDGEIIAAKKQLVCYEDDDQELLDLEAVRIMALNEMIKCKHLIFMFLTKRPQNIVPMLKRWQMQHIDSPEIPRNWMFGVSVSDQLTADEKIPHLIACKRLARHSRLFISYEPCVGPITWQPEWLMHLHGIILGGESGVFRGVRGCDVDWIRDSIRQIVHYDRMFKDRERPQIFVKQLGAIVVDRRTEFKHIEIPGGERWPEGTETDCGIVKLKALKGNDMSEWPADLRIRETLV